MIFAHEFALTASIAGPFNFQQWEQNAVSNDAVFRLLMAAGLGAVVGIEREWKSRAAGVRTNLLICMGCAFFTLLSGVLAGDSGQNKGQVAANIVQGIGFLGAGLILHNRNRVSGLASAASIFVVASIGMACGAGLYMPALIATAIVIFALLTIGFVEWRINLKAYPQIYEARGTDATGMQRSILDAMDHMHERFASFDSDAIGAMQRVSFSMTATKRKHQHLMVRLLAEPSIDDLKTYRDPEED